MAARDPLGVKPLIYGLDEEEGFILPEANQCKTCSTFPQALLHEIQVL
jgi:asparagine synthetase B (glutamine-hydrolysing)